MSEMQQGQQAQNQEPVTVTINDIATVVQVIDVVSRRGGFQGNELAGVGMLRNKLEVFLQQNAPEKAAEMQAAGEAGVDVGNDGPDGPLADRVVV